MRRQRGPYSKQRTHRESERVCTVFEETKKERDVSFYTFTNTDLKDHSLFINYETNWVHNNTCAIFKQYARGNNYLQLSNLNITGQIDNTFAFCKWPISLRPMLFKRWKAIPYLSLLEWNWMSEETTWESSPTELLTIKRKFATIFRMNGATLCISPEQPNILRHFLQPVSFKIQLPAHTQLWRTTQSAYSHPSLFWIQLLTLPYRPCEMKDTPSRFYSTSLIVQRLPGLYSTSILSHLPDATI